MRSGRTERVASTVPDALDWLDGAPQEQIAASQESLRQAISLMRYARDWEKLDVGYRKLVEAESAAHDPRSAAVATAYAGWAEALQSPT